MPQDAFTISFVAKELKIKLLGGKISRIVQPSRDTLSFIIYTQNGNIKLETCLSAQGTRISLCDSETPTPKVAPNFCMLLRKHLQNAQIIDIVQPDFERIIYFDLKCTSDFSSSVMRLYFELMGKYSNAILTENGTIVGALKTTSIGENTKRILFGGVKYCPPEPQDKANPQNLDELEKVFTAPSSDRTKFLCEKVKGLAYSTAIDIVETYGEDVSARNVYDYINSESISPCVILNDGEMCDFAVRSKKKDKIECSTLLEAQEKYFDYITKKKEFTLRKTRLESALSAQLKKIEKKLAIQRDKLLECASAEDIKLKGELITANIYAIQRGMTSFMATNYYDPECKQIKIELDKTLTPSQNAQKYYKKYAKLKRTIQSVTEQQRETEAQYDYFNSIGAHIYAAEELYDLDETEEELTELGLFKWENKTTKKKALPPYRQFEVEGFKVIAGRNNIQNERLTKGLSADDIWLHTQKYHSSHVGIITQGRKVPDKVLLTACEICAYYSDGREGSKIPVDYTQKKYVKKPPKSASGFVIYTDYSTALVDPDPHHEYSEGTK